MAQPGMERLREHLRRHNRRVLLLTVATVVIAVVSWIVMYFVAFWLFLLAGTVAKPVDFHPPPTALVRGFAVTGLLLCVFAWIGRYLRPNEAARDHKTFAEHFMDVLLVVPRVTLSIFGTGGATARLGDSELEHAWNLLRRMDRAGKPVPVQELPVDIPDTAMRKKIVLALQLSDLIEIRPAATGPVLAFRNDQARRLAQERVRLRY